MKTVATTVLRRAALALCLAISPILPATAGDVEVQVYKTPWCGCCTAWVDHLRANGFAVTVEDREDLGPTKAALGVPGDLASCHTATVEGYVIEGHVPASDIERLLAARPAATGLAVPGMPIGSPGMEMGDRRDPYAVILFGPEGRETFSRH